MPAAEREPDAQRVGAEDAGDQQIAELTGPTVGREAEEGEQERRGQDPGVGGRDRRELAEAPVQRRGAAGRLVPARGATCRSPLRGA